VQEIACKSLYKVTGVTGKSRAGYYTLFLGETRDKGNDGRLAEIVWLEDLRSNGKRTG